MIKANFNAYDSYVTDSLYQWDINQILTVTGLNLTTAPEVHFSNSGMDKAIVRQSTMSNHVVTVAIPNSLLQDPYTINAHIGVYEGATFKVVELVQIPIIPKKRPVDYKIEASDEEIYSFKALENKLVNTVKVNDFSAKIAAVTARIDNIIAHNNDTDGNTELVDIRTDVDGNIHNSAGNAIREQVAKLKRAASIDEKVITPDLLSFVNENQNNIFDFLTTEIIQGYYDGNGNIVDDSGFKTVVVKVKPNTKYYTNFYPSTSLNLSYFDYSKKLVDHLPVGSYEIGTIPACNNPNVSSVAFCVYSGFDVSSLIVSKNPIDETADNAYYFGMPRFKAETENIIDALDNEQILKLLSVKRSVFKNKKMLIFGDSITETATVSEDGNTYTEGTRVNWPTFVKATLGIGEMWNYAKSGAHYKDDEGLSFYQKISNQISTAIDNHADADIIVLSAGTNDANGNYGDYDAAMSVESLSALVKTNLYEAIRWAMWTLKKTYPNALCFVTTPIQRADREPHNTISDAIKSMGKRYNFIIMDAEIESGIIRENEIWGSEGVYLVDGLHPNESGAKKLSDLYCSIIVNHTI